MTKKQILVLILNIPFTLLFLIVFQWICVSTEIIYFIDRKLLLCVSAIQTIWVGYIILRRIYPYSTKLYISCVLETILLYLCLGPVICSLSLLK